MVSVNSYFSGAGLFNLGLLQAGININEAFELDADAAKTYAQNIGSHVKQCDIAQELVLEQCDCDGMVFTYPCTKYSTIADIHKTRTGDELFLHALRHLALRKPNFYIVENVVGMKAFPIVMEAMSKLPDYYVHIFSPINANLWLPQNRARLFIVGTRKPFAVRPPENTRAISLAEVLENDPDVTLPKAIKERMQGRYRDLPIISDPEKAKTPLHAWHTMRKTRALDWLKTKDSLWGFGPTLLESTPACRGCLTRLHSL